MEWSAERQVLKRKPLRNCPARACNGLGWNSMHTARWCASYSGGDAAKLNIPTRLPLTRLASCVCFVVLSTGHTWVNSSEAQGK